MPPLGGHSWHTDRGSSCSDTLPVPRLHHKETLLGKGEFSRKHGKEKWEQSPDTLNGHQSPHNDALANAPVPPSSARSRETQQADAAKH